MLILLAKLGCENTPTGIADWVTYRIDALAAMKLLPKTKLLAMTCCRVLQFIVSPENMILVLALADCQAMPNASTNQPSTQPAMKVGSRCDVTISR